MLHLLPGAAKSPDENTFVDAGAAADLAPGAQTTTHVGFHRVLVLRTADSELHAVADLCPHALQPLAGGEVNAGTLRCLKHGACFDLRSGQPQNSVTQKSLALFRVREREGRIEVAAPLKQ